MFASNGEGLADFDVFHPDRMASRILGMGDVLTLIEQAEKNFDAESSRKAAEKLSAGKGSFGLQDFLAQMQQLRKLGPLSKIFGMLPGAGQFKDAINSIDEKEVDRIEAIIFSMTPAERDDVGILNGSRRARIAKGAGVQVSDVNNLVKRFVEARKMMEQLAGGKMPGMPGMGGGRAARKQQGKSKKRGRKISGNPAKRKQQEAERALGIKPGTAQTTSPDAGRLPAASGAAEDVRRAAKEVTRFGLEVSMLSLMTAEPMHIHGDLPARRGTPGLLGGRWQTHRRTRRRGREPWPGMPTSSPDWWMPTATSDWG